MNKKAAKNVQKKQKANKALQVNDLAKAKKILKEICKPSSRDGVAWYLLSNVYGREKNYKEVLRCCKNALAANEKNQEVYVNLAHAHAALGNFDEAIEYYNEALKTNPESAVILSNLGTVLQMAERKEEAIEKFQQAISIQPNHVSAHCGLARGLKSQGEFNQAIQHYHKALQYDTQLCNIYLELGDLLIARGHLDQAEDLTNKALKIHPNSDKLFFQLSKTLQYQGKYAEAISANDKGNQINPNTPEGMAGAAVILERHGKIEKAFEIVNHLRDQGNLNSAGLDVFIRICHQFDHCQEAIELGSAFLSDSSSSAIEKGQIHHNLGSLFDKRGEFDTAFKHFSQANDSNRLSYDSATDIKRVDRLITAFSAETLAQIPRATVPTDRPIFIIGMPRSGTTLVEQIIASHQDVHGAGELAYINEIIRPIPSNLYPKGIGGLKENNLNGMAKTYLDRVNLLNQEAPRVTDKMPGNFRNLGLISLMLPQAKIIHCSRNPLDTCLSIFFQNFNLAHTYATRLEDIGAYYKLYERLMEHWRQVLDIPIFELTYSDMVNDQETQSRKLIEFCGLKWDDRCLSFHKTDRKVATASYDQVSKPVYRSSLERWKNYEKYLGPLKDVLRD